MDLSQRRNLLRDLTFPPPPPQRVYHRATGTNFPILAVAVIGILATAFLLVSYYVFVIKCCLNWHRIDILGRFSLSRRRRNGQDPLMVYSPEIRNRGLDESVIRAIPILKFKKTRDQNDDVLIGGEDQECSVCLSEFREEEKLRIIPNCSHLFHIDCIDVWLQYNANCPMCRTRVSCDPSYVSDRVSAPSSSPENPVSDSSNIVGRGQNDFLVIELGVEDGNLDSTRNERLLVGHERLLVGHERLLVGHERSNSSRILTENPQKLISTSQRKLDQGGFDRKGRKLHKVTSMGDECIGIRRGKDEQFGSIQPIRRSMSMDSSADRQLYLAVQEAISRQKLEVPVVGDAGGCSSSSSGNVGNNKVKRSFFSLGSSRRSRSSSILPLYFEP